MTRVFVVFGLMMVLAVSCKKPVTQPNSGIYRGTFCEIYDNGDTNGQGIAVIALTADGSSGSFNMNGDTATGAPYPCYGSYVVNNGTQMTFNNDGNFETGYHPNYVLDTVYTYTFDNYNFKFNLKIDTTLFEYKLIRI